MMACKAPIICCLNCTPFPVTFFSLTPATLALLFLEHQRATPAPGPLHLLFPLSGKLSPWSHDLPPYFV